MGNGIVSGSIGPDARWLSLGIAHPHQGRVVLTGVAPFPEDARHDPAVVRRYRAALAADDRPGLGPELGEPVAHALLEAALPSVRFAGGAEAIAFAPAGRAGAVLLVRGASGAALQGRLELQRAAYTQLTEGGPLRPWRPGAQDAVTSATAVARDGSGIALALAFGPDAVAAASEAQALAGSAAALLAKELLARRTAPWAGLPWPVRRAVAYALDCAACAVPGATALLADHELLPLVWTRDAYYVARLLLRVAPRDPRVRSVVDGFLTWCFERAERPGGWWPRSALASGQAKDLAFQLDQQLYPPLLLAEHARLTGDRTLLDRHRQAAADVLDALGARAVDGLIATSETPADDALAEPFHFSSHVLLWRTLRAFGRDAEPLRRRIRERFTRDGRFAYAIGTDGARHYHDANDLPTVLAPAWGFCAADDPVWLATVAAAWSERNEAHVDGPLGGLGSLHTLHPWPLGDLQRVIVARARGDGTAEAAAWERLDRVSTWDGLLPEAYDERTGAVASRHWFAWPVAVRGLLELARLTPVERLLAGIDDVPGPRA